MDNKYSVKGSKRIMEKLNSLIKSLGLNPDGFISVLPKWIILHLKSKPNSWSGKLLNRCSFKVEENTTSVINFLLTFVLQFKENDKFIELMTYMKQKFTKTKKSGSDADITR